MRIERQIRLFYTAGMQVMLRRYPPRKQLGGEMLVDALIAAQILERELGEIESLRAAVRPPLDEEHAQVVQQAADGEFLQAPTLGMGEGDVKCAAAPIEDEDQLGRKALQVASEHAVVANHGGEWFMHKGRDVDSRRLRGAPDVAAHPAVEQDRNRHHRFVQSVVLTQRLGVRPQVRRDIDYEVTLEDVAAWERAHGPVPRGAIVLAKSNMAEYAFSPYETIGSALPGPVWVRGEVTGFRRTTGGAVFFRLADAEEDDMALDVGGRGRVMLEIDRALEAAGVGSLRAGIEVRVRGTVGVDRRHSRVRLSLLEVDPAFTAGRLAVDRIEVSRRMRADGSIEANRRLEVPLVPQRVGLVTSRGSAAHADFLDQLVFTGEDRADRSGWIAVFLGLDWRIRILRACNDIQCRRRQGRGVVGTKQSFHASPEFQVARG